MPMSELELTGRAHTHVIDVPDPACILHGAAVEPFLALCAAAAEQGLRPHPVSAFRDFDAQLKIWNEKFLGRRTLYDRVGRPLDRTVLTDEQAIDAILHWSALPGASRHHWGTEIDVIDRAAVAPGQQVRLLPEEYGPEGPFARLTAWLDRNMQRFGFFRPYRTDRGGVSPEPWHLSYAPAAFPALTQLSEELMREAIQQCEIAGKNLILERLPEIRRRFVLNIDSD